MPIRSFAFSIGLLFAFALVLAACSSQRKLSQVETREPAAARGSVTSSPLRERLMASAPPQSCPPELREHFTQLVDERVKFPACPERLTSGFALGKNALSLEERSRIEELMGNRCRPLPRENGESTVDSLLQEMDLYSVQRARNRSTEHPAFTEEENRLRLQLRTGIAEVKNVHESLEQWVRVNGDHVISEEELTYFDKLITKSGCKLTDEEIDQSYRTLHSLETLARIKTEGEEQRVRIERLLAGVHKLIGRKIQEYFRR